MTKELSSKRLSQIWATAFLWAAGGMAVLIFVDKWTQIPLPFPGFWYTTRAFHVLFCAGLAVLGWLIHRNVTTLEQSADDAGVVFQSVVVFCKPECSLCDTAMEVLTDFSYALPEIKTVDISGDEELEELYASFVPVVEIDGRIRFRGIVSAELLARLIEARQRQQGRAVS